MCENIIAKIREFLDRKFHLEYDKAADTYTGEIYADYRDELCDQAIKKIFEADDPMSAFYESFEPYEDDCVWAEQDEERKAIQAHFEREDIEYDEDELQAWIEEHVCFNYPYDHYLSQKVIVDILVDTGDGNHDFVLNCGVYPHYDGNRNEVMSNEAGLVWLTKQQEYTKTQLNHALKNCKYHGSKFLESVRKEVLNCSSHMNALTFFITMTLGECLQLQKAIAENGKKDSKYGIYLKSESRLYKGGYMMLSKEVSCGLYDPWSGAGSILEISLEHDVKLPLKYISSALPDGCRGHGVDDVYGMCSSFWDCKAKNTMLLHR